MRKIRKRRVLNVIRHIKKVVSKQEVYSCEVAEIYDLSLRQITKSSPAWYDTTWHDDRIIALRFLKSKGYVIDVKTLWANRPSFCKGELFYMNTTRISISKGKSNNL